MADQLNDDEFPKPQDDFGMANPFVSPLAEDAHGEGFITRSDEMLNPWISMWMKPRATVRQMLETDPKQHVLLLAVLAGIAGNLDNAVSASPDIVERVGKLAGSVVGGAIGGIIFLYLMSWVVGITGRWLGGVAYAENVRTAWAWSYVPYIWMLPLTLGMCIAQLVLGIEALYGEEFVQMTREETFDFRAFPLWLLPLTIIGLTVFVWKIVITCKAVGEVHQFSGLRGLAAILLAGLLVFGVAMVIAIPIVISFMILAT